MIGEKIAAIAATYLGKEEIQPNQGFKDAIMDHEMRTMTPWQPGDPWCADLGILVWKKAYADWTNMLAWLNKWISPNSQQMARNAHADPTWPTSTTTPQIGAMAIFGEVGSDVSGHTACAVVAINGNTYTTIEGNTIPPGNPGNQREGYIVAQHTHILGAPHPVTGLAFIRFILPLEPQ